MDFNKSYNLGTITNCNICKKKEVMQHGCINYKLCGKFICESCKGTYGFHICSLCNEMPNLRYLLNDI